MPEVIDLDIPVLGETPKTPVPEVPALPAEAVPDGQNTGAEATPTKPEGEKPESVAPTPEQVAKRNQNRLDRKLDKAYRQRAEAQARADLLERQLIEERQAAAPKQDAAEPRLEQFDFDPEKYAQAKIEYAQKKAAKEWHEKNAVETARQNRTRLLSDWEHKVERGQGKYDDFIQVVGELTPDSPVLAAIMDAETGDDVAYYLSQPANLEEAKRIAGLSPLSQVREIGKLEAKLASEPDKPKVPSNAPAPIKPVGGSSSPSTKRLYDMSQDEFEKRRRAQIAQRR